MAVKFTRLDLDYILAQIKMAEAGQPPVNPLLSFGLREISGTDNNLVPGQGSYGSTDQVFPTYTDPLLQNAQSGTSYASASGLVIDAQPRMISNLISDQTANNLAAVAAQDQQLAFLGAGYQNTTVPGADGHYGVTTAYKVTGVGADGVAGTADDLVTEAGKDGVYGTADDVVGIHGGLLHTMSAGADGVSGVTTAYTVVSNGHDGIFGTADDVIDEWGANGVFDGQVAGSDDIVGTRGDLLHTLTAGADGIFGTADDLVTDDVVSDDIVSGDQTTPTTASDSSNTLPNLPQSLFINNVTADNGLSAPSNSWFTFFGQFFDHGLDMIDKSSTNFVFIPLSPSDPLYNPATPGNNFMVLARAADLPGPDGILGTADDVHKGTNQTSPFVDQSQTYASDPSHQVFLRAYMIGADGNLHSSGALLSHAKANGADGMATWADLKANAATFFGIAITDADVGNVPLLATDAYGNFIPGAHGLPQLVIRNPDGTTGLVEGNLATPISTADAVRTGHAFINDMAQAASPSGFDQHGNPVVLLADTGTTLGLFNADGTPAIPTAANPAGFYDNELLDAHYIGGDGRVNENIGLTAVQDIFHSEHDRLLALTETLIQGELDKGDTSFAGNWVLPGVDLTVANVPGIATHQIQANEWDGERLFQAAKFGTETEYQHIVFDEFARYVAPSIHVAAGVNVHIDPAITAEFANVVYRFGHSMLDENVPIYQLGADGKPIIDPATGQPVLTQEGLIAAFTNPEKFASDPNMTADLVLGTVNQVSNSIDEFVTGSLRNNLLGQPLDLAALNIARGRDTGVAPLNLIRNQLYAETGEVQLKAYASWTEFGSQIKHPESLINFVAAYGQHASLAAAVSLDDKRAAASKLVHMGTIGDPLFNPADPASVDAYNFMHSQGLYANNVNDSRAIHHTVTAPGADGLLGTADDIVTNPAADWSTGSVTGVDTIDMWVGGLAEKISLFGGQLGSTFEYVFRTQLEALQDGDRLYYLPRIEGMDYEESLQDSSLAQLIRANTGIEHLPGNMFLTPEYTIESSDYFVKDAAQADGFAKDAGGNRIATDPSTWLHNPVTGKLLVNVLPDGTVQFLGDDNFLGNTIVLGGTAGDDRLIAGAADDDTVWGGAGNDTIDGGGGNDFLFGGTGNDTILGGQGNDTIHGDEGNDTIYGGDGVDNIFGGDGNDYIEGGRGDDVILGGLGNDIIIGNEGADTLIGGEGDDWLESKGGQGDLMFGDSGAPTGGQPLYSGNDVLIGGIAGGDVMKGFSGDDIMVGGGSFTKFIGGLGFDWGSYENAIHGVSEDMNRKEFIAPNGSEDSIRDIWQHTEGASGSAFDDIIIGDNNTRALATKDELDNVNLITGLSGFFAPGLVSFDTGNIILGGAGNDSIKGGGGDDIIDGDAWLHVALTSYTADASIIRAIAFDPNGNTYDPAAALFAFDNNGLVAAGSFVPGTGHVNAANVDTAVFSDVMADYDIALFGKDAEGFLTIAHARAGAPLAGGNPQGLLGGNDGTDRIRNIERLQFTDVTVAIDQEGNIIGSSLAMPTDPNYATLYAPFYDAVPVGTPTITESGGLNPATTVTIGQTLTASVATLADYDGIASPISWQWQELDLIRGEWVNIFGATSSTFVPTTFQEGSLGLRAKASYVDGKGYTETVISAQTATVSLPGNVNTAPTIAFATQFNGISNTTSLFGAAFDFFSPFTSIFTDNQTAANALAYSATLSDGSSLASVGMIFTFDPVSGAGEFSAPNGFIDPDGNLIAAGELGVRVTATDAGPGTPLSVTNTFFINILPLDHVPTANDDAYSTLENVRLAITSPHLGPVGTVDIPGTVGVLANDTDPDFGDRLTAQLVSGPANGTAVLNKDGTFSYTPNAGFIGTDTFTYVANDVYLESSNVATVLIKVVAVDIPVTERLVQDTGASNNDRVTFNPALAGSGNPGAAVFATIDGVAAGQVATASASGAWTFTPVLADGTHTIVVTEAKASGVGVNTASLTFTLDTTPPPVTAGLVADTGASATDRVTFNPALSGTGDPNAAVLVSVDGGAAVSQPTDAAGRWTLLPALADGVHTVSATETDLAGNTGTGTLTFTLDTVAPAVTVALASDTGVSATDRITSVATLKGTADPGSTVFVSIDGGAAVAVATNAAGAYTLTPAVADGQHAAVVTETDLAGNVGTGSLTFTLDTLAPTAPVVGGFTYTSSTTALTGYTLSGTAEAGATVTLTNGGAATLGTTVAGAAGSWAFTIAPNPANNFSSTLTVTATDLAGNKSGGATAGVLVGGAAANTITATGVLASSPNLILGFALADTLTGGSGNDILDGGTGGDTMIGLGGDDTYVVDNTTDVVIEAANAGIDTVRTSLTTYTLGANIENLSYTGVANFSGTGNSLANMITGGAGADTLNDGGVGGADTLIGGAGNDTYFVVNAGDVIRENAGEGTDTVQTTLNSYTLGSNLENLRFAGAGAFTGTGNTLVNSISGGVGNDVLDGGLNAAGGDTLVGGAGNDTYLVRNATDVVTETAGGGTDTVLAFVNAFTLSANVEDLTFSGTGAFIGTGNTLANIITGGLGNDTLDGGANTAGNGPDQLIGGAGDDSYIVRNAGDLVVEAAGGGTDAVRTALASFTLAANVENLTYTGVGNFAGTGNTLANVIIGGNGNDTLNDGGVGGADTLAGGAGNDTYVVNNAADVITEAAGAGIDTVQTTLGSYGLGANLENLAFTGVGTFSGTGNALANTLTGGAGNDVLDGGLNQAGQGGDTMAGGVGDDTYIVRNAGDVTIEGAGAGTDTELAFINSVTLATNVENLTFLGAGAFNGTGNASNNVMTGGVGADTLSGGGGADTLIGGAGADTLTGGTGSDTFVLARGDANADLITDFSRVQGDQITLTGYAAGAALVKTVVGSAATPTSYAVQVGGVTQDIFKLTGNITLAAVTDYKFV